MAERSEGLSQVTQDTNAISWNLSLVLGIRQWDNATPPGGGVMEEHCSKCSAQLAPAWSHCPFCGTAKTQEVVTPAVPGEIEKAPVRGAFSGLALGILVAPMLIIVGTMLCLTGLGAFLGIPMIVGAIFAPVLGPVIGFGALKGKCPWCGASVSSIRSLQSFDCSNCKQRIVVRLGRFVRVE